MDSEVYNVMLVAAVVVVFSLYMKCTLKNKLDSHSCITMTLICLGSNEKSSSFSIRAGEGWVVHGTCNDGASFSQVQNMLVLMIHLEVL